MNRRTKTPTDETRRLATRQWELVRRLPAPRRVRADGGTRFLYGFLIVAFVIAPAAALGVVFVEHQDREAFRSRGVAALGRLVSRDVHTGGHGTRESTSTTKQYEFEVDGTVRTFNTISSGAEIGTPGPAEIVYLPDDPDQATSRAYLNLPLLKTNIGVLVFVAGGMPLIGWPAAWFLSRPFRRHGRLLRHGLPGIATVETVVVCGDESRKVKFSFVHDGTAQSVVVIADGPEAAKIEAGQRLAMLYDPAKSSRVDLFFAAIHSHRIQEPFAGLLPADPATAPNLAESRT
jgi:hypothetical protein